MREKWRLDERNGEHYFFTAAIDGVEWTHHVRWADFWAKA